MTLLTILCAYINAVNGGSYTRDQRFIVNNPTYLFPAAGVVFGEGGSNDRCQTSDGTNGVCRPFSQCKVVLDTFRQKMPTICRWMDNVPVVCCPNPTLSRRLEVPGRCPFLMSSENENCCRCRQTVPAKKNLPEIFINFFQLPSPKLHRSCRFDDFLCYLH